MNYSFEVRHRLYVNDFDSPISSRPLHIPDGAASQTLERVTEDGRTFVRATGPWWADPNHVDPGAGWLHLIAYDYFGAALPTSGAIGSPTQQVDMRNATYSLRVRLDDLVLPEGAHLVFWFQAFDPAIGRHVNYANIAVRIDEIAPPGEWTDITIQLTTDESDWIALGTSLARSDVYGISESISAALSTGFPVDCGLIILLGNDIVGEPPAAGSVSIDDVRIVAPNTMPDVLYDGLTYNGSTGEVTWYDAFGGGGSRYRIVAGAGLDWAPIGVKQVGAGDTQVIWRDGATDEVGVWNIVNGEKKGHYQTLGFVPATWELQAPMDSSDLDGNGFDDLVWRDSATGAVTAWLMGDGAILSAPLIGTAGLEWTIVATGDLTGDGVDDILWSLGSLVGLWEIQGGLKIAPYRDLESREGHQAIGLGDFRGDGTADILWLDQAGAVSVTNIVNGAVRGFHRLGQLDDGWRGVGITDINGDGIDDLLTQDGSPQALELVSLSLVEIEAEGEGAFVLTSTGLPGSLPSAVSVNGYSGDFVLGAEALSDLPDIFISMNSDPRRDNDFLSLDFFVQIYSDGLGWIYEDARFVGTFVVDEKVWMWREGNVLNYGTGPDLATASGSGLVRSVPNQTMTLYFDSLLRSPDAQVRIELSGTAGNALAYWATHDPRNFVPIAADDPLRDGLPPSSDLDGNGFDDVLQRDGLTGMVSVDLMDAGGLLGSQAIQEAGLEWGIIGTGDLTGDGTDDIVWRLDDRFGFWEIVDARKVGPYRDLVLHDPADFVGVGDFLGDGSADILWRDPATGDLSFSDVVGGAVQARRALGPLDLAWDVVGIGDIDGDGVADLLLRKGVTGEMRSWNSSSIHATQPAGGLGPSSDLDGNGFDDVLQRDGLTGMVSVDLMDAGGLLGSQEIQEAGLEWGIIGTGDLTGDGTDDIVWRLDDRFGFWEIVEARKVGPYRDLLFHDEADFVGVGDFLGDGSADILWRDPATGELSFSDVVGGVVQGELALGPLDPAWQVVGIGDIDGDGVADLSLHNPATGATASWITPVAGYDLIGAGVSLPNADFVV